MKKELWKPVVGYESLYEVSNFGRVRSFYVNTRRKSPYLSAGDVRGYRQVLLCKNGIKESGLVHRLVARAFIGEPPTPKHQVNHRDFNQSNNCVENLEWMTHADNNRYSSKVIPRNRGEANHSKLTDAQVLSIRKRYAAGGVTQRALADEVGISNVTCNMIVRRLKWKHI